MKYTPYLSQPARTTSKKKWTHQQTFLRTGQIRTKTTDEQNNRKHQFKRIREIKGGHSGVATRRPGQETRLCLLSTTAARWASQVRVEAVAIYLDGTLLTAVDETSDCCTIMYIGTTELDEGLLTSIRPYYGCWGYQRSGDRPKGGKDWEGRRGELSHGRQILPHLIIL